MTTPLRNKAVGVILVIGWAVILTAAWGICTPARAANALATSSAFAGTSVASFNVTMQVVPSLMPICTISVYQPPIVQQIPIKCTSGTQYTVETNADENGRIPFAGAADFSMTVYQDTAMSKTFGKKANGNEYAATSTGGSNYPANGLPPVGNYSGDIVYTVTF